MMTIKPVYCLCAACGFSLALVLGEEGQEHNHAIEPQEETRPLEASNIVMTTSANALSMAELEDFLLRLPRMGLEPFELP